MFLPSTFCGIPLDHFEQMQHVFPKNRGQLVRKAGIITVAFGLFNVSMQALFI